MTVPNSMYPVFLQLQGRKVLVVGGGSVAERKVRVLRATGADIHVGAPALTPDLAIWAKSGDLRWLAGTFDPSWMEGAWLVIAATDERNVNAQVRDVATQRRIWINVVDDPELTAFQVPAVVDRSPLTVAISSGGAAPVLARRLRERLEAEISHHMGTLAALLTKKRAEIRAAFPDMAQRRHFYDWTLDGPLLNLLDEGRREEASATLDHALTFPESFPAAKLSVVRVHPADPGLLTLKALRALHEADALIFDPRIVDEAVVAMSRRDAERITVNLEEWKNADVIYSQLNMLTRDHGRVVYLVSATQLPLSENLEHGLRKLEEMGLPVQRLIQI